jgi:hypothetical protein
MSHPHPKKADEKQKTGEKPNDPPVVATTGNEGEGSRSAARAYDAGAERAAKDAKKVEALAEEAKEALDGPEGEELRKAEQRGKNAGKGG